nr:MAG TPA_asm: hypothetical protein [Caudoviricetes sp.]
MSAGKYLFKVFIIAIPFFTPANNFPSLSLLYQFKNTTFLLYFLNQVVL